MQSNHDVGSRYDREASSDSTSERKDLGSFGHQIPSPWQSKESHTMDGLMRSTTSAINSAQLDALSSILGGLPTNAGSSAKMGGRPPMTSSHIGASGSGILVNSASGSTGTLGQQRFQSTGAGSPSGQSAMHQRPPSPSVTVHHPHQSMVDQDYPLAQSRPRSDSRTSSLSGHLNSGLHGHPKGSSSILASNIQIDNLLKDQSQDLTGSSSVMTSLQPNRPYPATQPLQSRPKQPEVSGQSKKLLPHAANFGASAMEVDSSENSITLDGETLGKSSTSSLLAAVFKSGILSNSSLTNSLGNRTTQDVEKLPTQSDTQPPLPSGPPPTLCKPSDPRVLSGSQPGPPSVDKSSASANNSERKIDQPPLPPGPPPPSIPSSKVESKASNPISNLLSTLVAKGLISASKSGSQSPEAPQKPSETQNQNPSVSSSKRVPVSSLSISAVPPSAVTEASEPAAKSSVDLPQSSKAEIEGPIGLKFKPDVIREFHSSVISELFDNLPHRCNICGLRLKLKERLDRHLEWHALKEHNSKGSSGAPRRWYTKSVDWVAGKAGLSMEIDPPTVSCTDSLNTSEKDEIMVPADENQCACLLCGELFEDYYCLERDQWMFKSAVYLTLPSRDDSIGSISGSADGPIVHANCISESSVRDLWPITNDEVVRNLVLHM